MYMIIYWLDDESAYSLTNLKGAIQIFDKLEEADISAKRLEEKYIHIRARVISIEDVKN